MYSRQILNWFCHLQNEIKISEKIYLKNFSTMNKKFGNQHSTFPTCTTGHPKCAMASVTASELASGQLEPEFEPRFWPMSFVDRSTSFRWIGGIRPLDWYRSGSTIWVEESSDGWPVDIWNREWFMNGETWMVYEQNMYLHKLVLVYICTYTYIS